MSGKSSKPVTVSSKSGPGSREGRATAGSYLSRQAKAKKVVNLEDELKLRQVVTPEDVRSLTSATKGITCTMMFSINKFSLDYLCSREANVYGIEFTKFRVRDMTTETVLFEVEKDDSDTGVVPNPADPTAGRYIRYKFPAAFLDLTTVGAS